MLATIYSNPKKFLNSGDALYNLRFPKHKNEDCFKLNLVEFDQAV